MALEWLQYVQFPWRLIGLAGLLTVLTLTLLFTQLPVKVARFLGILACLSALYTYGGYFHPKAYDSLTDQDFITGAQRKLQQQDHLFDYLPKTVKSVPDFATELYFSSEVPLKHETRAWQSNNAEIILDSPVAQDVSLSIFNYPGWVGHLNGEDITLKTHPNYGLITVSIPAGQHTLSLTFTETPTRRLATAVSVFSFGILILGATLGRERLKK